MGDRKATAREYLTRDIDEAIGLIDDARKLMSPSMLGPDADVELTGHLIRATEALTAAGKVIPRA